MYWAKGLLRSGVLFKKKSVSGGSFITGKSVKEELLLTHYHYVLYMHHLTHVNEINY